MILCHDAAYVDMAFDGYRPPSILEVEGAMDVAVEFHSLSKTYNMTGWRVGFAAGNPEIIAGLGRVKTNIDSGVFQAVQYAGMAALEGDQKCVADSCRIYQERRDLLVNGLEEAGLKAMLPKATFYVWCGVPKGYSSAEFTSHLPLQDGDRDHSGKRLRRARGRLRALRSDRGRRENERGGGSNQENGILIPSAQTI